MGDVGKCDDAVLGGMDKPVGIIRVLSETLANQIAAGEVVERPASVVKELVENALDAGASHIAIRLEEAGLSGIEVEDDGKGMSADDLHTAFLRHATSKIAHERDLFRIRSLGFRGEALPSIASVSRLEITSATEDGAGLRLYLEAGEEKEGKRVAARKGTLVKVQQLFFNTPARLKYLRSVQTELGHVLDVVSRLGFAHPQVTFVLQHQGRELLRTPGTGRLLDVIQAVYGTAVTKNMLAVQAENTDFSLDGWLSRPELTRSNRSYLNFLVNGRAIRNVVLGQSVLHAYHTMLPTGRFPIVVLHVKMDPQLLDVNVHPSKLEVRFSKEQALAQWLQQEVKAALKRHAAVPEASVSRTKDRIIFSRTPEERSHPALHEQQLRWMMPPALPKQGQTALEGEKVAGSWSKERKQDKADLPRPAEHSPIPRTSSEGITCVKEASETYTEWRSVGTGEKLPLQEVLLQVSPVAQVHGTYILAQGAEGLYLVDQHAAQERILYERFRRLVEEQVVSVQPLLMPLTVEMAPQDFVRVVEQEEEFRRWGVEWEIFGADTLLLRALPVWIPADEAEHWFWQMVYLVTEGRSLSPVVLRDRAVMTMACKAAIKANRHLQKEEMEQLLTQLAQSQDPLTCPHGRPVVVHLSTYDLEKMFKRVM